MFGNNESVFNSSIRIDAKVREAVAVGFTAYYHIPSHCNLANVVSKHWGYNNVWMLLQSMLFWSTGDTADIPNLRDASAGNENT